MRKSRIWHWHYNIRKPEVGGMVFYGIVKKYRDPAVWTVSSVTPLGKTKQELMRTLERMLRDAKKYPVIDETRRNKRDTYA